MTDIVTQEHRAGLLTGDAVFQLDIAEARLRQAREHGWKTDWLRVKELAESLIKIADDYPAADMENAA